MNSYSSWQLEKEKKKRNCKDKSFYFEFYPSNLQLRFTPQENPVIILLHIEQNRTSKKNIGLSGKWYYTDMSYEYICFASFPICVLLDAGSEQVSVLFYCIISHTL